MSTELQVRAMHEQCSSFIAEYESGTPLDLDHALHFVSTLRGLASVDSFANAIESTSDFDPETFRRIVVETEARLEKLMARQYIAGERQCIEPEMSDGYDMAEKEGRALSLDAHSWLYFIGCGAAPLTAMRYFDLFGARTVCIDRDAEALALAREMLTSCYGSSIVEENFRFRHESAELLELPSHSVSRLLLAAHCRGKESLMRRLKDSLTRDGRMLVRLPAGLYRHVYDTVDFAACGGYRQLLNVYDDAEPFCQAALLLPTFAESTAHVALPRDGRADVEGRAPELLHGRIGHG